MIKIEKQVRVVIDGEDVQALKNVCEAARVSFAQHPQTNGYLAEHGIGQWTGAEVSAMFRFLDKIDDT